MNRLVFPLALAALGAATPSYAALPLALDGSWYNPLQSGHGLTLERIDHDSALLFWHVFDPAGRPLTLYIQAGIEGNTMKGEVLAPSGMRFGRFEESELALPFWGKVELSFSDCTHATLTYDSPLAGYGQGEIPLTRLISPGEDCSLQAPAGLVSMAGSYVSGQVLGQYGTPPPESGHGFAEYFGDLKGFVTEDGGLALHRDNYSQLAIPTSDDFVLVGAPVAASAGEAKLQVRVYPNGWLDPAMGVSGGILAAGRIDQFALQLQTRPLFAGGLLLPRESIEPGEPYGFVRVSTGRTGEGTLLSGVYPFLVNSPGTDLSRAFQLEVASDLTLCVRAQYDGLPARPACVFTGQASSGRSHFEFELSPSGQNGAPRITGAGQARYCRPGALLCDPSLRMIGDDGRTGLSIFTRGRSN